MKSIDKKSIAKIRMDAMSAIRVFFIERGYVEIETPILVQSPDSEPTLTPFETSISIPGQESLQGALITSPEYTMKKLLGEGHEKIFSLGKVFRNNEAWDKTHALEFTMLEWYETGIDYKGGMNQTQELIHFVANRLGIKFHPILKTWNQLRIEDLFEQFLEIKNVGKLSIDELMREANTRDIHTNKNDSWSDVFYRLYVTLIEPNLPKNQGTILYDYPTPQAALARACEDGVYAERFELFYGNLELCNAFTELTDADQQRLRFEHEQEASKKLDKTLFPIDEELLSLLPSVPNPTFGNALGVDRLLMALLELDSIEDVLLFPPHRLFHNL